jgi:hypothetical protein
VTGVQTCALPISFEHRDDHGYADQDEYRQLYASPLIDGDEDCNSDRQRDRHVAPPHVDEFSHRLPHISPHSDTHGQSF